MEKPAQNNTLIELHIPNFKKAKNFYTKLGFKVIWERKPEGKKGYLVMQMDSNILCFWAGNKEVLTHGFFKKYPRDSKRGYAVEIIIVVKKLNNYYKKIKGVAKIVDEIEKRPWGLSDFRIEDPFGYYIRITTPHNILDSKYAVP